MEYRIEFTLFLDSDVKHAHYEIRDMLSNHLDSAGVNTSVISVEFIEESDDANR